MFDARWCSGSTADFGSADPGSNPGRAAPLFTTPVFVILWYDWSMKGTEMAKIAISLPDETLAAIEREREVRGETRSAFVRRIVEKHLKAESDAEKETRYIQGYIDHPDDNEDVRGFLELGLAALAEVPWETEETSS